MSFAEAETIITNAVGNTQRLKADYNLDRMQKIMLVLGNPQDKVKVVHVAGTSGKTSTSYFIASLLQMNGKKVGLTVSPHIESIRDRVQINLVPLSEQHYAEYFAEFWQIVEPTHIELTYFEILVAFAYWVFAKEEVDYAVVEVGLGGLLDGTNVVMREDKVCVITDIGFDHVAILGNTLPEIAAQKAGIIQQNNLVLTYEQDPQIMEQITTRVGVKKAHLEIAAPEVSSDLQTAVQNLPLYQQHNWQLAYSVWMAIKELDNLNDLSNDQLAKTMITVPGRQEVYENNGKTIILDGAHNPQKAEALAASLAQKYSGQKFALGLAIKEDKDYQATLGILLPLATKVIATKLMGSQDILFNSVATEKIADVCEKYSLPFGYKEDHQEFLNALLDQPDEFVLITGSLYLVSSIRGLLTNEVAKTEVFC